MKLGLSSLLCSVRSLKSNAHLLKLGGKHVATTLRHVVSLTGLLTGTLLILNSGLKLLDLTQVLLDLLHGLSIGTVGMVQGDLKLIGLSLKRSLHGLQSTGMVLASVLKLILLLSKATVNLSTDLRKLKLSTNNPGLFLLKSSLSLLKGGLELLLLHLQLAAGLVQLMDRFATLTKLVGEVVDLISQDLVLPLETLNVFQGLFILGLELEELG